MRPELSLYLDVVRFVAALVVFIAHFTLQRFSGGFLWPLNALGHEAVTVFFVLSGFVIAYATDGREKTLRDYTLNRCARMYSVVLPALVLTLLLDAAGRHWNPAPYGATPADPWAMAWHLLSGLSFTNELWTLSVPQGSNTAYWSLGYEVPFYAIFGVALYTPARWRAAAVGLAVLVVGPSIAIALPVWLAGVAAYRFTRRGGLTPQQGVLVFLAASVAWGVYELIALKWGRPLLDATALFKRKEIIQDYIVCALFTAQLIGFHAAAPALGGWLLPHARTIRWLAGATFTLYLCHMPVAQFLAAISPWPLADPRSRIWVFAGTLLAIFAIAEFTERRKPAWRRIFEAAWPKRKTVNQT